MRTPSASDAGEWRPTSVTEQAFVDRSVSLNAAEAAIARRIGEGGGEVVDVELEVIVSGFAPVFPWMAQLDSELVKRALTAAMGASPASWDKVEAAFLSLSPDSIQWHPLSRGALPPPIDGALRAIAHHAAPLLLTKGDGGWRINSSTPEKIAVSLAVPYLDSRTFGLRWRFSDFLAAQPDPKRHLIDLSVPAPLEGALLLIANDVPLASGGIQSIEIEVKTGGPTGRVSHVFLPGQPSAARVPFVRQTFDDLNLEWRAILTISTARGTTVVEAPGGKTGVTLELTPVTIGVTPLRFRATAEVFAHVSSVEVTVGARVVALTAQSAEAWVVGRTPPATCQVSVTPVGGSKMLLGDYPVDGGLTADAAMIGVGDVATVALRPAPDLSARAAYLAVQVEGAPWRSLDFGSELKWPVQRENRLAPPRLRYRTRHVPRTAAGATSPMLESPWKPAEGLQVEIGV
jgi:hypothetical protein